MQSVCEERGIALDYYIIIISTNGGEYNQLELYIL